MTEELETHDFDFGYGQRVDDVDVQLYEMSRMNRSDAVQRAKKIHADETDTRFSKLVARKLHHRGGLHRESRTYVVVAKRSELR